MRWQVVESKMSIFDAKSTLARKRELSGQFDRVLVAENADGFFELLDLERLLQNGDRAFGQNAVEHRAVGVTGDDDDGAIRLLLFKRVINIIGRPVRQF